MRDVHEDLFDRAVKIFEKDGFDAARDFLIEQTKFPYKPLEIPNQSQPKRKLKRVKSPRPTLNFALKTLAEMPEPKYDRNPITIIPAKPIQPRSLKPLQAQFSSQFQIRP